MFWRVFACFTLHVPLVIYQIYERIFHSIHSWRTASYCNTLFHIFIDYTLQILFGIDVIKPNSNVFKNAYDGTVYAHLKLIIASSFCEFPFMKR